MPNKLTTQKHFTNDKNFIKPFILRVTTDHDS